MRSRILKGLEKTKAQITKQIRDVLGSFQKIDEELFDELEEILITSDIGVVTTDQIMETLRCRVRDEKVKEPEKILRLLKEELKNMLKPEEETDIFKANKRKKVILIVGVNGAGKTTSVGKLASIFKARGNSVLVAGADTFRAAAIDQLRIWSKKAGADFITQKEGADPSAVIFDAIEKLKKNEHDVLICDTAGRLHNRKNLMMELSKMYRTIEKNISDADIYTLLVVDASTGQNGLNQAKLFKETSKADGLILTKIDGTARGGIIFPINNELGLGTLFLGVGEGIDDLRPFDREEFIEALFTKAE